MKDTVSLNIPCFFPLRREKKKNRVNGITDIQRNTFIDVAKAYAEE